MDKGQNTTDNVLKDAEDRINSEYKQAIEGIEAELNDYLARFELKDKKWQEWVKDGKKTEKEYQQWRIGQMAVGKRWSDLQESIAEGLYEVNEASKDYIMSVCPEVFAENYNFSAYEIEKGAGVNTSFTTYNKEAVQRLIEDNPEVLPPVGKKVAKEIAEGKAVKWNKQQLQSVMIQGILQGDSIPKLATRLANTVGDRDRKAAIRNARTMAIGAQNAGRVEAYKRMEKEGVKLKQMWVAVKDERTRHSHRQLDGEVQPVGEAFSNGCKFPADPAGRPEEIYNCRCKLRSVIEGLEPRAYKYLDESKMGGMSYEEWKEGKGKSQDILHQDKVSKAMRSKHAREYGGVGGGKPKAKAKAVNLNDYNSSTQDTLLSAYENHNKANNLNRVSVKDFDQNDIDNMFKVYYGNIDPKTAKVFDGVLSDMADKYDTTLTQVRLMNKNEFVRLINSYASVNHDYTTDVSTMLINPVKCGKYEKMMDRLKENLSVKHIAQIKEENLAKYIPTHEFAHTLINMQDKISNKTNWVQANYDKVTRVRKEVEKIYSDYIKEVGDLEKIKDKYELDFLNTFNEESANLARQYAEEIDKIKISNYSMVSSDEFFAESFAKHHLGEDNKYSKMIMEIIEREYRR